MIFFSVVIWSNWAILRGEFSYLRLDDILHDWEGCFQCRLPRVRNLVSWIPFHLL